MGDEAFTGELACGLVCKDVDAADDFDQFMDPLNGANEGIVPFFKVDLGVVGHVLCALLCVLKVIDVVFDEVLSTLSSADNGADHDDGIEDLLDGALIEDHDREIFLDEVVSKLCLDIGEADDEVGLEGLDFLDAAANERADNRVVILGMCRTHGVRADAHDAMLFAEGIEDLCGLLCEAYNALWCVWEGEVVVVMVHDGFWTS